MLARFRLAPIGAFNESDDPPVGTGVIALPRKESPALPRILFSRRKRAVEALEEAFAMFDGLAGQGDVTRLLGGLRMLSEPEMATMVRERFVTKRLPPARVPQLTWISGGVGA